jgi:hypothetical protein
MRLFGDALESALISACRISSRLRTPGKVHRDGEALIAASLQFIQLISKVDMKYINPNIHISRRYSFPR